jgi:omega-6 fatty acid desaturase (delta-12 desaturase)
MKASLACTAPDFPTVRGISGAGPGEDLKATVRRLTAHCARFSGAETKRSAIQLATTTALFLAAWAVMVAAAVRGAYWIVLLLALPAAGLAIRMFIFQHDCGHGSFWTTRRANTWTGRLLSLVTLTPYDLWRREHALHHSTSGNLNRRGVGDFDLLTVREYRALPRLRRLAYRIYRNPFIFVFVVGPAYFFFRNRLPLELPLTIAETCRKVMPHNLALAALYGTLIALIGAKPFLIATLAFMLPAYWAGIWLFFIQHQYEEACWYEGGTWDLHAAALLGSSYFVLPPVLRWFTGNIGLHHAHHLCPKVPNYKLQRCVDASPELAAMNRLTLGESLACGTLALWDEDARKLIRFSELQRPGH